MPAIPIDTRRNRREPRIVECTAIVEVGNDTVGLTVNAMGGPEATEEAFDRMDKVLDALGYTDEQRVRIY